jgi:hypothetical protein
MSDSKPEPGTIGWVDLTVSDAGNIRDFYKAVVGWEDQPQSMGDYDDYNMALAPFNEPVAGICHARGVNAGLPAQWLIYVVVEDLDGALENCRKLGGKVLTEPRNLGKDSRIAVIQDPAGAVMALWE